MATINYQGPDGLETPPFLFDVEFELVGKQAGRAIVIAGGPEDAVSMTEKKLLNRGVSINNSDVYDVIYIDVDIGGIDERKSVVIGMSNNEDFYSIDVSLTEMTDNNKDLIER